MLAQQHVQELSQVDFLVRWLNGNILKNQLDHFPQDLVSSNGRHLYDMIEFLCGKQARRSGLQMMLVVPWLC